MSASSSLVCFVNYALSLSYGSWMCIRDMHSILKANTLKNGNVDAIIQIYLALNTERYRIASSFKKTLDDKPPHGKHCHRSIQITVIQTFVWTKSCRHVIYLALNFKGWVMSIFQYDSISSLVIFPYVSTLISHGKAMSQCLGHIYYQIFLQIFLTNKLCDLLFIAIIFFSFIAFSINGMFQNALVIYAKFESLAF